MGAKKKESGPPQSNSTPARSRRFSPGGCSRYWLGFEVPIQFEHSYSFPCLCSMHTGPLLRGIWASPLFVVGVSDAAKKQQHLFFSSAVRKVAFFFSLHFSFSCKFLFVKNVLTTSNIWQSPPTSGVFVGYLGQPVPQNRCLPSVDFLVPRGQTGRIHGTLHRIFHSSLRETPQGAV